MAEFFVDLDLATGSNDGTTWANAYQDTAGMVTAVAAATAGETVWVRGDESTTVTRVFIANNAVGDTVNPVRIIAVNQDASPAAPPATADLVIGFRTGTDSLAYAHADSPALVRTGTSADLTFQGSLYLYGLNITTSDNILFSTASSSPTLQTHEECSYTVSGAGDLIVIGALDNVNPSVTCIFRNCKFD